MGLFDDILQQLQQSGIPISAPLRGTPVGAGIAATLFSSGLNTGEDARLKQIQFDAQNSQYDTPSERGASTRAKTMAQQQPLEPTNFMPQDEDQALAILQGELTSQAQTFGAEATQRRQQAEKYVEATQGPTADMPNPYTVPTDTEIGAGLQQAGFTNPRASVVITNATLGRNPDGSKTKQRIEQELAQQPKPAVRIDPDTVAQNVINSATPNKTTNKFDVQESLKTLQTLSGDEAVTYANQTLANIELAMANEYKNVRMAANLESGFSAAQAAFERNVQADAAVGFMQRFGHASGQTILAQQEMERARGVSHQLESSLAKTNANLHILNTSKASLAHIVERQSRFEDRKAQSEAGRTARREAKKEDAAETVSNAELANYRYAYSKDDRDDLTVKADIAAQRRNDKVMDAVLRIEPENIHQYLANPDGTIRSKALQIFEGYERANNARYADKSTPAPMTEKLRKILTNPNIDKQLEQFTTKDEREQLKLAISSATGQEKVQLTVQRRGALLARYIENETEKAVTQDVRKWQSGLGADNPFAQAVNRVSSVNPTKAAPMNTVVETFITTKVPGANGQDMDFATKIKIMEDAITNSTNNIDKTMLSTPATIDAIRVRSINAMKIAAARAFVRAQVYSQQEREAGMELIYSRGFRPQGQ